MRISRYLFLLFTLLLASSSNLFADVPVYKTELSIAQKKKKIRDLYERKRYTKVNEAIDLLLPLLIKKIDRAEFEFYQAHCNFHQKKYSLSADQFHGFSKHYPSFPQVEEAIFMRGYALSCENVDIRLDQTATYDAIRCLENYLMFYPTGTYRTKAADALHDLEIRLMHKHFQAACLYVRLGCYNAAIVSLKNFQETYPETPFKEKLLRLFIKCHEKLAMRTSDVQKKEQVMVSSSLARQELAEYLAVQEMKQPIAEDPKN